MHRRLLAVVLLARMALSLAGCHNKKVQNPIANINSAQPDKVLFDRAMEAMKHNKFDVARMTLQTMINAYPDSEFVARAKLAIGDSWYAEGGTAAWAQAESEYKDFKTFFPNMPEAAEAQMKVANIHYQQMEKADRDYTHAKRAEDEYRALILEYPDSKLVPEAKQRLRDVQEVLAEREFLIGRFYYLRESWPAAIARLKSVTDTYPLYSAADEALFMLGDCYERQLALAQAAKLDPAAKGRMEKRLTDEAAQTYAHIITRYPVTERAEDAKKRLQALHRPVPTPTQEAIAQNKAEEESRSKTGTFGRAWGSFHKHPDMAQVARVGDPTLVDPKPTSAPAIVKQSLDTLNGTATGQVSVEKVGTGKPGENEAAPRSNEPAPQTPPAQPPAPATQADPSIGELTPGASGQASDTGAATAPAQVNEAAQPEQSQPQAKASSDDLNKSATTDDKSESSSKNKKKKGLKKLNPF